MTSATIAPATASRPTPFTSPSAASAPRSAAGIIESCLRLSEFSPPKARTKIVRALVVPLQVTTYNFQVHRQTCRCFSTIRKKNARLPPREPGMARENDACSVPQWIAIKTVIR